MNDQTMIRAVEIWTQKEKRWHCDAQVGTDDVGGVERQAYDNDLFAEQMLDPQPRLYTDSDSIHNECIARTSIAEPHNIGALLCLPCIEHNTIQALVLFFLAPEAVTQGAVEIWSGTHGSHELHVCQGYYPQAQQFGTLSSSIGLPYGSGLPGRAWSIAAPQVVPDIGTAQRFLRSSSADNESLGLGIAIPIISTHTLLGVCTLLSPRQYPSTRVVEIWRPHHSKQGKMDCADAFYQDGILLSKAPAHIAPGNGLAGRAWSERTPVCCNDLSTACHKRTTDFAESPLTYGLALPIIVGEDIRSVICLYW